MALHGLAAKPLFRLALNCQTTAQCGGTESYGVPCLLADRLLLSTPHPKSQSNVDSRLGHPVMDSAISAPGGCSLQSPDGSSSGPSCPANTPDEVYRSRVDDSLSIASGHQVQMLTATEVRLMHRRRSQRKAGFWGLVLIGYGAFAYISVKREWPVMCPFRRITRLRCPLCGVSTTLACLVDGDMQGALHATLVGEILSYVATRGIR